MKQSFESLFFFEIGLYRGKSVEKTEAIIGMKKLDDDESRTFDFIVIKPCVISTIESGFVGKKQLKLKIPTDNFSTPLILVKFRSIVDF